MFELNANMTQKQLNKVLTKVEKEFAPLVKEFATTNCIDTQELWWIGRLRAKAIYITQLLAEKKCRPVCVRAIGPGINGCLNVMWPKGRLNENGKPDLYCKADGSPDLSKVKTHHPVGILAKYNEALRDCLSEENEDALSHLLFQAAVEQLETSEMNNRVNDAVKGGSILAPSTLSLQ
jgi:hypothetical protein